MWKVLRYVAVGILFFMAVFFNVNNTINTMESSEQARIADIGDSMAEALENSAVNVLEKNLDPNMKARGISVIKDTDSSGRLLSEADVKNNISREVANEFKEYQSTFNKVIDIGGGQQKPLFEYEILAPSNALGQSKKGADRFANNLRDYGSEVSLGNFGSKQKIDNKFGSLYVNVDGGNTSLKDAGDTRDREQMRSGMYPQYNATLRIRFYSILRSKNLKKVSADGTLHTTPEFGAPYELDYPISVTIRHVNTEDPNYN